MDDAQQNLDRILNSSTYVLAEQDIDFLARRELRPVRLQLELLKPEMAFNEQSINSTIVVFGSARVLESGAAQQRLAALEAELANSPHDKVLQRSVSRAQRLLAKSHYYDAARKFARIVSEHCQKPGRREYVIVTGGGPGIMEAANRGAFDVGAKSIGLNITLPTEQAPNPYITPSLCFQFHYFALRKMHFLMRAAALVLFPGGFGTLDEFFDAITLRQTQRMQEIPIILFGREHWNELIDFQYLADEAMIDDRDLDLIQYADTPEQAWELIAHFHGHDAWPADVPSPQLEKRPPGRRRGPTA